MEMKRKEKKKTAVVPLCPPQILCRSVPKWTWAYADTSW